MKQRKRLRQREKRHTLRMESLEHRLCLAASFGWDGPGQGGAELSYYIGDVPANVGLEQAEVESAIETALSAWSDVADLTFTPTTLARQSDSLDITFTSIDGSGGILAQAYLPDDVNRGRLAGDIEFDLADPWELGNDAGRGAFDLVYVAAHEIGHALGLDHLNVVGSVLRPSVSPNQVFTSLSAADEAELLEIYAPASDATTDPITDDGQTTDQNPDASDAADTNDDDIAEREEDRRRHRGNRRGRFGGGGRGRAAVEVLIAGASHHNCHSPTDVNDDGFVTALDALTIINYLNENGPRGLGFGEGEAGGSYAMIDVNGDEVVSALDVLMVVNGLDSATPASITVEDPVVEMDVAQDETSADELVTPDEADTTGQDEPVDDTTDSEDPVTEDETGDMPTDEAEDDASDDDEVLDDQASEDDVDDEEADNDDTITDDTVIDDGGVEEDHAGCHGGRRDPFAQFDINADGLLTVDEVPEMFWARFMTGDTDADGGISPAELEAIAQEHHRRDPIAMFDANEDGALTADEVPERLWEKISRADSDDDGAVTADELVAARPAEGEASALDRRLHGGHHWHRYR